MRFSLAQSSGRNGIPLFLNVILSHLTDRSGARLVSESAALCCEWKRISTLVDEASSVELCA